MVGLFGAAFLQMLARVKNKGRATKFLRGSRSVAWLSFFPGLGVTLSVLFITISLGSSVWVRYDNHSSAVVAANHSSAVVAANHSTSIVVACILGVAVFLCIVAMHMYHKIQCDCREDMHSVTGLVGLIFSTCFSPREAQGWFRFDDIPDYSQDVRDTHPALQPDPPLHTNPALPNNPAALMRTRWGGRKASVTGCLMPHQPPPPSKLPAQRSCAGWDLFRLPGTVVHGH